MWSPEFISLLDSIQGLIRWPLQEMSGDVALARNFGVTGLTDSSQYPGPELFVNHDFALWSGDNPVGWTTSGESGSDPKISEGPNNTCQVFSSSAFVEISQPVMTIGKRYICEIDIATVVAGSVRLGETARILGVFDTAGKHYVEFVATTNTLRVARSSVPCDVFLNSVSLKEANPLNGDNDGATVGQPFGGNIPYSYSFDGNNDYVDIYSAALNSVFDSDNGAIFAFGSSNTWAAGIDYLMQIAADVNNTVYLSRSGTDLILSYTAGGTAESVTIASGSPTGVWMVALTWDVTGGGAVKAFFNGVQSGATQTIAGTWAGVLGTTVCNIGANATTPTNVWAGNIAECGLIVGRTPPPSEIAEIYARSGI
jgi:hypothetical protein